MGARHSTWVGQTSRPTAMQFVWLGRVTDFPCQEKAAADGDAAPSTAGTSGLTGSSKSQTLAFCQDLPMQADIKADGGAVLLVFHSLSRLSRLALDPQTSVVRTAQHFLAMLHH